MQDFVARGEIPDGVRNMEWRDGQPSAFWRPLLHVWLWLVLRDRSSHFGLIFEDARYDDLPRAGRAFSALTADTDNNQ